MARFTAVKSSTTCTKNLAGGVGYSQNAREELVSVALTSLCRDLYYETPDQRFDRVAPLVAQVGPRFAMQCAVYTRQRNSLRSISHVLAGEIAHAFAGSDGLARFFDAVVVRPDDMAEIISYYTSRYGSPRNTRRSGLAACRIPNAMKRGFRAAFNRFDAYQLAKWRMETRAWSLVDLVNVLRPVPVEHNADALASLVNGTLRRENTWEDRMSAGNPASEVFGGLLRERKLGYNALLMNLRTIAEKTDDETQVLALEYLQNETAIRNSRTLPFDFWRAYKALGAYPRFVQAIGRAFEASIVNVPDLPNTVVAIDVSGSMEHPVARKSETTLKEVGAILGSALAKRSGADLMVFASDAGYVPYNPDAPTLDTVRHVASIRGYPTYADHGTSFTSVLRRLRRAYERIVYVTDCQGWQGAGGDNAAGLYMTMGRTERVYELNVAGYGTTKFPNHDERFVSLSGVGTKVFDFLAFAEQGIDAIVREIESIAT